MKVAAIICEYNPFHNGHIRQLRDVRETIGEDGVIVSLMSGLFVQRGDAAVLPIADRVRAALLYGADLVLELPSPWSHAASPYFAEGAVRLLDALGCVDTLCFGSETGDTLPLLQCAEILESEAYQTRLDEAIRKDGHTGESMIRMRERILKESGADFMPTEPNDRLAVEYLRALKRENSAMVPLAFPRQSGYSATAARNAFAEGNFETLKTLVPPEILAAMQRQSVPASLSNGEKAILYALRMTKGHTVAVPGGSDGSLSRLLDLSFDTGALEELWEKCADKRHTDAHFRRLALNTVLGVTPEAVRQRPTVTRILGFTDRGRVLLSSLRRRQQTLLLLTKQASSILLPEPSRFQRQTAEKAAALYSLCHPASPAPSDLMREGPVIVE